MTEHLSHGKDAATEGDNNTVPILQALPQAFLLVPWSCCWVLNNKDITAPYEARHAFFFFFFEARHFIVGQFFHPIILPQASL